MPVYIEKYGDLFGCHHSGTTTRKDRATQPMDHGRLRWAKKYYRKPAQVHSCTVVSFLIFCNIKHISNPFSTCFYWKKTNDLRKCTPKQYTELKGLKSQHAHFLWLPCMHHLNHVHLSTPLTLYLVLLSSIGKPDSAILDILRPLIPGQIAFWGRDKKEWVRNLSSLFFFKDEVRSSCETIWTTFWNIFDQLVKSFNFCTCETCQWAFVLQRIGLLCKNTML